MNILQWITSLFQTTPIQKSITTHYMKASFFAGPQDHAAFLRCKAKGLSDLACFAVGDNCIGKWGHDTSREDICYFALPREDWMDAKKKGGDAGFVTYKGKTVKGMLGDTLPARANIKNGVGIDLNPGFAVAFGIPVDKMNNYTLEDVKFEWE